MDINGLMQIVESDSTISSEEKNKIFQFLKEEKSIISLASGGLGLLVGKFLKLSKPAQVLLTLAGFGLSRILIKHIDDSKKDTFTKYDKQHKIYEIRP